MPFIKKGSSIKQVNSIMKIKQIMISVMFASMVHTLAGAETAQLDKSLAKPELSQFSLQKGEHARKLQAIFDQQPLNNFYAAVQELFGEINKMDRAAMTPEDLSDLTWCFYLICAAPLYSGEYMTDQPWPYDDSEDISSKYGVTSFMASFDIDSFPGLGKNEKKYLRHLNAVYFASVINLFRSSFIPDLDGRMQKLEQNIFDTYQQDPDQFQARRNNLVLLRRRNHSFHSFLRNPLEIEFVEMLVKYFPDNANDVLKYIRMAGYQGAEVSDLIDRTVGRDGKTEYLYKGRIGQEHKKKMKRHDRNPEPS